MKYDRILIVVDMQKDFIDGALGTPEAVAITPAAAAKLRAWRAEGLPAIATLDTHGKDYLSTREGRFLPVEHCIKGTPGWKLNGEIAQALGDGARLEKPSFGSMALPNLVRELTGAEGGRQGPFHRTHRPLHGHLRGLQRHDSEGRLPEAEMRVDSACCAGVTPDKHRAALETMASCQITII